MIKYMNRNAAISLWSQRNKTHDFDDLSTDVHTCNILHMYRIIKANMVCDDCAITCDRPHVFIHDRIMSFYIYLACIIEKSDYTL